MSRQRFIHPEMLESEDYQTCSLGARVLFVGLIVSADDHGRGKGANGVLRGSIFPEDKVKKGAMDEWKRELSDRGMARFYKIDGRTYYDLPGWSTWQRPKYQKESKVPPYQQDAEIVPESGTNPGQFVPESAAGLGRVGMGREGKGREGAQPPGSRAGAAPSPVAIIPCLAGKSYRVTETDAEVLADAYPAVDVLAQLKAAVAWCHSNPSKRKTVGGAMRFLNNWMRDEQNKSGRGKLHHFETKDEALERRNEEATRRFLERTDS